MEKKPEALAKAFTAILFIIPQNVIHKWIRKLIFATILLFLSSAATKCIKNSENESHREI